MALSLSVTAEESGIGIAITDSYVKLAELFFDSETGVSFRVVFFASAAARAGSNSYKAVQESMPSFDHQTSISPKAQIYTYLKTLPAYSGAVDV
jgi:hypothetical protein